ncbi:hypothetical protein E2C01_096357 [Portunus trituberculatus]|uniref:Uncharacterized protein n=1 Tax=Portunus trituberculatus TaxID=210409 RepID=A0A5B7K2K3_PORTR|nr:hypothetical protein [Portunus trituberculatus]
MCLCVRVSNPGLHPRSPCPAVVGQRPGLLCGALALWWCCEPPCVKPPSTPPCTLTPTPVSPGVS